MNVPSILQILAQSPDAAVESRNDAKCKALLAVFGMLEEFTKSNTPNLSVVTTSGHPTHWIVGALWSGYQHPEENGYQVVCLPKNQTTEQRLKEFVDEISKAYGGHSREDSLKQRPDDWQKLN